MRISDDKLRLFQSEGDLQEYLTVNGLSGNAQKEHLEAWKNIKNKSAPKAVKKTTMVVTETDDSVELK